jgi:class 3 adenylate cyclase
MFSDLVDSTMLASRLDPEELGEVIGVYHRCVADVVGRFDGFLAKYLGDGVLAYFGYPTAHEDDAERAIRAGLEVTRRVAALSGAGEPLSARVGIATGLVVVGEIAGSGDANAVVGETPNLAARLQAEAPPGGVVNAPTTRRLTGEWFRYLELGARSLKGIAEPMPLTQLLEEQPAESRFAATRAALLTPFVGREQEIGLLLDRWHLARGARDRSSCCPDLRGPAGACRGRRHPHPLSVLSLLHGHPAWFGSRTAARGGQNRSGRSAGNKTRQAGAAGIPSEGEEVGTVPLLAIGWRSRPRTVTRR